MKEKVILAICAAVIVASGVLALHSYNNYRHKRNAENAYAAAQQALANKTNALHAATVKSDQAALKAACQQVSIAYNALTPAAKLKVANTPPNCNLQFVQ